MTFQGAAEVSNFQAKGGLPCWSYQRRNKEAVVVGGLERFERMVPLLIL